MHKTNCINVKIKTHIFHGKLSQWEEKNTGVSHHLYQNPLSKEIKSIHNNIQIGKDLQMSLATIAVGNLAFYP